MAETTSGAAQAGAQQLRGQRDVAQVALGQRAVAQAHAVEPRAAAVQDAGGGGDAQVVGLAAVGLGGGHLSALRTSGLLG